MTNEDIEKFKRELRSYKTYKKYLKKYEDDLLSIDSQLINLKSPKLDGIPSHTGYDNRIDLIEKKDKIVKQIDTYKRMIQLIDDRLNKLEKVEKDILVLVYMENVTIRKIGRTFYMSDASVFRWINRSIRKALT